MITFNPPLHFSCNSELDTDTEHWNGENADESLCHTRSKHNTSVITGTVWTQYATLGDNKDYLSFYKASGRVNNETYQDTSCCLLMNTGSRSLASLSTWITSAQLCMDGCKKKEDLLGLKGGTNRWSQRHKAALYLTISQSQQSTEVGKTERKSRT